MHKFKTDLDKCKGSEKKVLETPWMFKGWQDRSVGKDACLQPWWPFTPRTHMGWSEQTAANGCDPHMYAMCEWEHMLINITCKFNNLKNTKNNIK